MKVGIFGGCFNPPHSMHEKIALTLLKTRVVDKVVFVPTGNFYRKKDLIEDHFRYQMLSLICQGHSNLCVSNYELKDTLCYTYQTLQHFHSVDPGDTFYFILGTDNVKDLITWKEKDWMIENCYFLVIGRDQDNLTEILKNYHPYEEHFIFVPMEKEEISSTEIRNLFYKKDLETVQENLNPKVFSYIVENYLYSS